MKRVEYFSALKKEFEDSSKFQKLAENPLASDDDKFRKMLHLVDAYTDKEFTDRNKPHFQIKSSYGFIKSHKENYRENLPMRPIINGQRSILSNFNENFLIKIFENFKINNVVKSSKFFSEWFKEQSLSSEEYDCFSLDCEKLFPSIPNPELIDMSLDEVYEKNKAYQMLPRYRNENGHLLRPIPKHLLEIILKRSLCEFTAFECDGEYYRQLSGLAMGETYSPILANFFLSRIETPLVQQLKASGVIKHYHRYADDSIIFCKKGQKDLIFEKFNSLHPSIKFTQDLPIAGKLKFLDFQIVISESQKFEIVSSEKEYIPMNFKTAVAPANIKIGVMKSDFIRSKMKNSRPETYEADKIKLKNKYLSAGYPVSSVCEAETLIPKSNSDKIDWAQEKADNPERNFTLCIPFTDFRVRKITSNIKKIVSELAPDYNLLIASKTIKLRSVILSNLYSEKEELDAVNCIYKFTCECKTSYIGESENAKKRIAQHGQRSGKTAVFPHIDTCEKYKSAFEALPDAHIYASRGRFLKQHFEILEKNLNLNERRDKEAIYIKLEKPKLNIQVAHRSVTFI